MNRIRLFFLFLALLAPLLWASPGPVLAQDDLKELQFILEKNMARQSALTDDDVRTYLRYAEPIYRLRFEPDRQAEVIREINYWDENRFAYVTAKMAVGMSLLLRPAGDSRNNSIPNFARPTQAELALIKRYEDQLVRAMEMMQAKYPGSDPS